MTSSLPIFHGYFVLVATFSLYLIGMGTEYCVGVLLVPLQETFHSTRAVVSLLQSIYIASALLASSFTGSIMSMLSRWNMSIGWLFAVGSVAIGVGCVMESWAYTLDGVLGWGVLTGIGVGWTGYTAGAICVQWFVENRGTMTLLGQAGAGMGNFFYVRLAWKLIEYFNEQKEDVGEGMLSSCFGGGEEGWRKALRVMGLSSAVIGVFASSVMRLPLPLEVDLHEHPDPDSHVEEDDKNNGKEGRVTFGSSGNEDEYGSILSKASDIAVCSTNERRATPNGIFSSSVMALDMSISRQTWKDSFLPVASHRHHVNFSIAEYLSLQYLPIDPFQRSEKPIEEENLSFSKALWTVTVMSLILWQVCYSFSLMAFYEHLPAFAASIGLPMDEATGILSLSGLAYIAGNLTLGIAIDRYGAIVVLRGVTCLLSVVMFSWPHCKTMLALQVVTCIYGYCTVITCMPLVILADVFGSASPSTILSLNGILYICSIPGYLSGPSVVGYLYDLYGSYISGASLTSTVMIFSIVALGLIPQPDEQKKRLGIQ